MPPDYPDNAEIKKLLSENKLLLTENNQLLKKLKRATWWGIWFRLLWFAVIIGLPFVVYYYLIQPYFDTFGSSVDTFREGIQEVPGWKQFYESISGSSEAETAEPVSGESAELEEKVTN